MTDLEKRKALSKFCRGRWCDKCPLKSPICRCGCGTHFLLQKTDSDEFDMTEEEINAAYAIAFPKPIISQWELDRLREHEKEYYKLLKERDGLINALTPLIKDIVQLLKEQED